jgi:hypothetical protein
LPFGLIPSEKRRDFAADISGLYEIDSVTFAKIANTNSPLVICMVKGFKPGGDDNRPDRGILPLVAMLSSENAEVMTFIYGPVLKNNYMSLCNNPASLALRSGFWRVFMSLSNFFVLDVPLLPASNGHIEKILDNTEIKNSYISQRSNGYFCRTAVPVTPNSYHEDDVDTIVHSIFKHLIPNNCFEGMCNPPGGDWSGMSIVFNDTEYRWLSLPRVSTDCKRPDHVIELFGIVDKPILLVVESKDRKIDLETNVGNALKAYLNFLFSFRASVEKRIGEDWRISEATINDDDFLMVSAGAYISNENATPTDIFSRCNCDMVFALFPNTNTRHWDMRIFTNTPTANMVKEFVVKNLSDIGDTIINII